ncbi:MAG: hypothetical protein VKL39_08605 [Leptolyngbyaceae bacterium]|nr:hypothetical protein [Leptolyngbyaceae bacterium]
MSFFEFLIQREGDRSWLPIESSEVEILEGRYRIMGRSPQPNLSIDIRISYLDLDSVPPRRRTHKRTSQTNAQGLVAVMPFTALRNGKWGIQCSSPPSRQNTSESTPPNPWQHQIQLQVLEDTAHHVEDFEPEYASVEPGDLVNDLSAQPNHDHHELKSVPAEPPVVESTFASIFASLDSASGDSASGDSASSDSAFSDSAGGDSAAGDSAAGETANATDTSLSEASPAETNRQSSGVPNFSDMSLDQIQQLLEQLDPNQLLTMAEDSTESPPIPEHQTEQQRPSSSVVGAPRPELPKDLPIDLDSLSPDIRDDIANVFQTVDSIAEEILASIGQRMNSAPPSSSPHPNDSSQSSIDSSIEESLQFLTDDPLGTLERLAADETDDSEDDALFTLPDDDLTILSDLNADAQFSTEQTAPLPTLQIRLDYDAWSLGGDRQLVLTGAIQSLENHPNIPENADSSPESTALALSMRVHLTDPQTGTRLSDTIHPITLSPDALTPFHVLMSEILPTHATVMLGEAFLYASSAPSARPVATQTFVVTTLSDNELASEQPESSSFESPSFESPAIEQSPPSAADQSQSAAQLQAKSAASASTSLPPFMQSTDKRALAPDHEKTPSFRISHPSASPAQEEDAEPPVPSDQARPMNGDRPPLDLPDFVKSPTSLASSILGLAGLSPDVLQGAPPVDEPSPSDHAHVSDAPDRDSQSEGSDEHSDETAAAELSAEPQPDPLDAEQSDPPQGNTFENPQENSLENSQLDDSQSDSQADSPFDLSSSSVDENLSFSAPEGRDAPREDEAGAWVVSDDIAEQERANQEVVDQEFLNPQPFRETVNHLEHVAQMTHEQLTDSQRIEYDDIDPFDLLDEPEEDDFRADTPYRGTANLAQQFIPDYSDDSDPFDEFDADDEDEEDDAADWDPFGTDALLEESTPEHAGTVHRAYSPVESPEAPTSLTDAQEVGDAPDPWTEDASEGIEEDEGNEENEADGGNEGAIAPPLTSDEAPSDVSDSVAHASASLDELSALEPIGVADKPRRGDAPQSSEPLTPYSVLPNDVEVPTPTIECLDNEIIAGQSFYLTVTLPKLGPRIFVKLWIQDRHTRTLLDGPRWLADFVSLDDSNLMQAKTQLTIPLGAMEVRIEAIAMEMMTQRESYKVSLDKSVLPPDMPFFSLEDPLDDLL